MFIPPIAPQPLGEWASGYARAITRAAWWSLAKRGLRDGLGLYGFRAVTSQWAVQRFLRLSSIELGVVRATELQALTAPCGTSLRVVHVRFLSSCDRSHPRLEGAPHSPPMSAISALHHRKAAPCRPPPWVVRDDG